MDIAHPYRVISRPLDGAALRVLTGASQGLTGRRIASLAGEGSHEGIRKALRRLVAEGVVEQSEAGNAILYRLNRRHLAAPAIQQLSRLRQAFLARLTEEVATWEVPPLHASVFGSAARGDGDSGSDVDLFVVGPPAIDPDDPRWRAQIEALREDVRAWTGNRASIVEVTEAGARELRRRNPALAESLRTDASTVAGLDVWSPTILGEP
jgi:predicted nucleotidyltransferase